MVTFAMRKPGAVQTVVASGVELAEIIQLLATR
ncbi:hypothetical protein QFZ40_002082 [Arthrobacter pascens]|nr:hypothetical protein [Arthrobacter pascens]